MQKLLVNLVVVAVIGGFTGLLGTPVIFAQSIELSNGTALMGNAVTFDVSITQTPNAVSTMGFNVTYDSNVLEFVGMDIPAGSLVQNWTCFDASGDTSGVVTVGGFTEADATVPALTTLGSCVRGDGSADPIAQGETGVIASLRFNVAGSGGATLSIAELVDEVAALTAENGVFVAGGLDVDLDGQVTALGDIIVAIRFLFGSVGEALTLGAVNPPPNCTRCTAADIIAALSTALPIPDVDGDGQVTALGDGLLVARFLFGSTGEALTAGAVNPPPNCTRCTADDIIAFLGDFVP